MPSTSYHCCCKEVKDICIKHTCSYYRSKYKARHLAYQLLNSDKEYCICWSLHLRMQRELSSLQENDDFNTTTRNADTTLEPQQKNDDNLKSTKKIRRGIEDILVSEF